MRVPLSPGAQLEERPLTPPYQQISAPPDAFGAGIAQETRRAGAVLGQAADHLFQRSLQVEDQQDATAAQTAYLAATKTKAETLYDPDKGIAFRQGINARGMTTDGLKSMEEIGRTTRDGLTNDRQRQVFDRLWGQHSATETTQLSRREAHENQVARTEAQKGMIANAQTMAAQHNNDPAAVEAAADQAERAVRAGMIGQPPELVEAKAREAYSHVQKAAILTRMTEDPLAANRDFERVKSRLDAADLISLQERLKPAVERVGAQADVDAVTGRYSGGAGAAAGNLVSVVHRLEGGGRMTAGIYGDGGKAAGPMQVHQGALNDVNKRLGANYTHAQLAAEPAVGKKVGETYLGMMREEFGRDDYALGAYNAGPGAMKAAIASGKGVAGLPESAQRYVANGMRMLGGTQADTPAAAMRGLDDMLADLEPRIAGRSPEWQDRARSGVIQTFNQQQARTHVVRADLAKRAGDVNAALADGRDVPLLEETAVRGAFLPEQADVILRTQKEAQMQGQVMQSVAHASAADVQAMLVDLDAGTGPISAMHRLRSGRMLAAGPDGAPVSPNNDPEDYRHRRQLQQKLGDALTRRTKLILDDPATYAASNPALRDLVAAGQGPQAAPAARAASVQVLMAEQARLGVPENKRRALPVAEADALVGKLTTLDPSQADVGAEMGKMAQSYGAAWPAVFGDLVKAKLPGMYQVLMAMPDAAARGSMQIALSVAHKKGGVGVMREAAGDQGKAVDTALYGQLADFRATTVHNNQGGIELLDRVHDAARLLGYQYTTQGMTGEKAAEKAVADVLGAYEFDGTARVPKGMKDDVRTATRYAALALKPEDIAPVPGNEELSEAQRKEIVLRDVRQNNTWVPNEDSSGLVLMHSVRDSSTLIPVRPAGDPKGYIQVRFDSLPKPAGPARQPYIYHVEQ